MRFVVMGAPGAPTEGIENAVKAAIDEKMENELRVAKAMEVRFGQQAVQLALTERVFSLLNYLRHAGRGLLDLSLDVASGRASSGDLSVDPGSRQNEYRK